MSQMYARSGPRSACKRCAFAQRSIGQVRVNINDAEAHCFSVRWRWCELVRKRLSVKSQAKIGYNGGPAGVFVSLG